MQTIFILTTIVMGLVLLTKSIAGHRLLTLPNVVFVTTVVNFILYLCGWSANFAVPCSDTTYLIVVSVEVVFTVYALFSVPEDFEGHIDFKPVRFGKIRIRSMTVLLLLSLILLVIENLYLHGGIFAIDSSFHTGAMPVIGPINRALIPVSYSGALIEFADHRSSKSEVVLLALHMVYSIIGARGRFWFVVSAACALMVLSTYKRGTIISIRARYKLPLLIATVALLVIMFNFGTDRIAQQYSSYVAYTGPFQNNELMAWYYGYFPYSFYNLDLTVRSINANHVATYGAFLLLPFLSVLQLDGLFGLDYTALSMGIRVVTNTAATVATGYYEMYSDFGYLFLISIFLYLAITAFFEHRNNFASLVSSRYMWVVWGGMSFLNIFTVGIPIYVFIIALLIDKLCVEDSQSDLKQVGRHLE